jgi:TolB-like protein
MDPNPSAEALFHDALAQPEPLRAAFLDQACGNDLKLRGRIETLLAAHAMPESLEGPSAGGRPPLEAEEKLGDRIGRYRLVEKIGEGGCGTVYTAEQEEPFRRLVALKVIKLGMDTKAVVARFDAERQALALMDHPNIAKVFDAGATGRGRPFFVMEIFRGTPITEFCDAHQLAPTARLELFIRVCQAVQHAHEKGIIHRDLKPSNILVAVCDGTAVPKIIDFGIAKATQGRLTAAAPITVSEQFIGTPAYMSPEQADTRNLEIDTRSDIYSLGVLLYELLTGRTPFDPRKGARVGVDEMRQRIRETEPVRPSSRLNTLDEAERRTVAESRSTLPAQLSVLLRGDLDWIVMRCLEKDRQRRYATAQALALDLQRHLRHEAVEARPASARYLLQKFARRNRGAVAGAAAVAAVLLLAAAAWYWFPRTGPAALASRGARTLSSEEPEVPSIAVLPFTNLSPDKGDEFFADALHEDLLVNLANIGALKVISRTSVLQYRGTRKPIRQIGAELGVGYILEGSVRRAGNQMRVTSQLINARTEGHVWSASYDKDLSDALGIQAALATQITSALRAKLSPLEKTRLARAPTTSAAAYELFLKAHELLNREDLDTETLTRAEALVRSALEFDPKFAAAWGHLADLLGRMGYYSYDTTGDRAAKIRQAVETMERLAPDEPETWLTLSNYYLGEHDHARSESYLLRAAQALPNNGEVILLVTEMDKRHGRWSEALGHYRRAHALDRQNPEIRRKLGEWLLALRRYDEAAAFAREMPDSDGLFLAQLPFYEKGSTQETEAWIAAHPQANRETIAEWKFLTGAPADYIRLMDEIRRGSPSGVMSSPVEALYASALMAVGETERAREAATRNVARWRASGRTGSLSYATNLALLGEKQAALEAYETSLAPELASGVNPDFFGAAERRPFILALLGKKEAALAEFARELKVPCGLNVHAIRRSWMCRSLQGDPAFEALLNDPANNAPIP